MSGVKPCYLKAGDCFSRTACDGPCLPGHGRGRELSVWGVSQQIPWSAPHSALMLLRDKTVSFHCRREGVCAGMKFCL